MRNKPNFFYPGEARNLLLRNDFRPQTAPLRRLEQTQFKPNQVSEPQTPQSTHSVGPQRASTHAVAKGSVFITIERCKGCGFCVEFCPTHVLALSSAFNSKGYHPPHVISAEKCSGCDLCGMYCPDFAIFGSRHAN